MGDLGSAIGGMVVFLASVAAFGVMALLSGLGLALWSIWLPITLWQAIAIMAAFGCSGVFLISRIK
ncbi:hypothetical protein FJ930_19805 [Mesorhizobium sp. B2-4-15]|uniref:hypothetical protein n=1 Tax=Mesorhizobium sp. B2-4-15 TaxID=2589934 RepID=UPI00114EA112|nr:hypothetical protein [Mesorhizobium sp. B2-4-15]TPK70214.1 hypothetical protein FJ930_19805 [Mesorhizobium sp. B2-4-15]